MIRELVQTLVCLSVLNGSTLSLHLSNDRTAEHSSSSSGGNPSSDMLQLHQHTNNPYRAMAAAAESDRERMLLLGGGRRGHPIVTGRLHLTVDEPDGGTHYQAPALTMLQDNEFPIRREPFFFIGDDEDAADGGGGGFEDFHRSHSDLGYDDGSYEVMDDIFNHDDGLHRKFPLIRRPMPHQYHSLSTPARGLQELFDHHETADQLAPSHRSGGPDMRLQKKLQRKRTQQKQALKKLQSSGSKAPSTDSVSAAASASSTNPQKHQQQQQQQHQERQQNINTNQPQQQLLHPNSNNKRSGINSGIGAPPVTHSIASQLMLRTARGQRQYDVPQIECPSAIDGMERFACPTPDLQGRYRCIDDHVLCDGFIDCPEGEDEDRRSCMFYKTTKAHLDVLADALLRWARGR